MGNSALRVGSRYRGKWRILWWWFQVLGLPASCWVSRFLWPEFLGDAISCKSGAFLIVRTHILIKSLNSFSLPVLQCFLSISLLLPLCGSHFLLLLLKVKFLLHVLYQLLKLRSSDNLCLAIKQPLPFSVLHLLLLLIQLVFEFSDSQAIESELDTLGSDYVVKLFDVLTQGSILS